MELRLSRSYPAPIKFNSNLPTATSGTGLPAALCVALILCWLTRPALPASASWDTLVDGNSFNNPSTFQASWAYNYPWGTDHNGSARMNATNVLVANGKVTLVSSLTNYYEGASSANPYLTIRYNSGTFYLKQQIRISAQYPFYDISGQFQAPTQTGCWPAFWMTGAHGWPPESDFMEFKGSAGCNQNTYNGSWQGKITTVSTAKSAWHSYRVVCSLSGTTNVDFHYYIDDILESMQTANTFVATSGQNVNTADCNLMVDYQMEGSAGAPGPAYTTYTYASNIVVKRINLSGVPGGPVPNGIYQITARNSGYALDVGNQNTTNNSPLDQWPANSGLNQQWLITHLGANQYCIIGRQSGRALQVAGSALTNGAPVTLMNYTNGNNQKWTFLPNPDGSCGLRNVGSGKLLEVAGNSTAPMAPIDQWSAAGSTIPQITTAGPGGTNLVLRGSNGVPGVSNQILSAANIAAPAKDWVPAGTVVADKSGNFTLTNQINPAVSQQFYLIRLGPTNGAPNQQWLFQ